MEKLILSGPSSSEIEEKAILDGMLTVYQDGLIKVLTNQTTINEVERVAFQE
jgi:type II secretory ATPase GspE/PulE/Tfp pilus assembly ATPase PilB-like protein